MKMLLLGLEIAYGNLLIISQRYFILSHCSRTDLPVFILFIHSTVFLKCLS